MLHIKFIRYSETRHSPNLFLKEIGCWVSTHDVSVEYGQGYALDVKRNWLSKAYSWIDGSK